MSFACLSKFTHIRPGCLTADASDLQIGLVPAITIRSHKTSAEYEFTLYDGEYLARELLQEQTLENLQAFSDRLAVTHKKYLKTRKRT